MKRAIRSSAADALRRHQHPDPGVGTVAGGEERQAVGVVPVEVAEQDRPAERASVHDLREVLEPGPAVQDQLGAFPVPRQGDAGGVPTVSDELRPRGGSRCRVPRRSLPAPGPQVSSRWWPSESCFNTSGSIWSPGTAATRQSVTAASVEVR